MNFCGHVAAQEYWGCVSSSFSALSEISELEKPCLPFPVTSLGFGPLGTSGFSESYVRSVSPKTPILSMEILTVSACLLLSLWPPRQGVGQLLSAPHVGFFSTPSLQEISTELVHCSRKVFKVSFVTRPTVWNVQLSPERRFPPGASGALGDISGPVGL